MTDCRGQGLLFERKVKVIFEEIRKHIEEGERLQALEKFQNLALMGLSLHTDFFRHAAMFGGTSLRIFHGLPRFSEDLDFTVNSVVPDFSLSEYKESIVRFFADLGFGEVRFTVKEHGGDVSSGSLVLSISRSESLRVKIDAEKPRLSVSPETETLYGSYPFQYPVRLCTLSSSFAGKMDAILHRRWGGRRIKGRDWYDFLWYMRKGTELNIFWLEERLKEKGTLDRSEHLSPELLGELFEKRAASLDVREIIRDVGGFMTDALEKRSSAAWSTEMFLQQKEKLVDAAARFLLSHKIP